MFIGTWALIRPMRNIFSPVSGWNALSYKYLHLHNSSSVIFKSSRLSPFLCNNCLVNVRTENSIKWVGNYLYFVTTSRACSSCPPVANRFKGFVTARKWSALPLYVLWSQYGFSMSILSFDILPTPATPRSFPHTCSFVPSAARTHTRPHNPTTPGSSPAAVSFARLDSKSTWARFHTGWSSREDAQASPATESNRCTTRYRPSLLDLSIPILLSLSTLLLSPPSMLLSITPARLRDHHLPRRSAYLLRQEMVTLYQFGIWNFLFVRPVSKGIRNTVEKFFLFNSGGSLVENLIFYFCFESWRIV